MRQEMVVQQEVLVALAMSGQLVPQAQLDLLEPQETQVQLVLQVARVPQEMLVQRVQLEPQETQVQLVLQEVLVRQEKMVQRVQLGPQVQQEM